MKILTTSALIAGVLVLGACGSRTPAQNSASNIMSNAENRADTLRNTGDVMQQQYENRAQQVIDNASNRADAVLNGAAPAAPAGNHSAGH